MRNSVLVTGGAGYIGCHTCKALSRRGYLPVTYDNLSRGHKTAVKWGPLELGDVADRARLSEVLEKYKPIAVIHFAAFAYVGESVGEPLLYFENNVAQSIAMLDVLRRHGVNRFVFSSTCAVYGVPPRLPITEDTELAPINPYGASKLMVERILRDCSAAFGLESVSLRYFNAAGADGEGEIGEEHAPETHLIPLAMQAAVNPNAPLQVFGTDYDTRDGSAVRDYVHVEDLAAAHIGALDYLLNGGKTTALNVGTGKGASVLEFITPVENPRVRKVRLNAAPPRPCDPAELVANPSRLKAVFGLDPGKFAPLDQIIADAWRWHLSHHNRGGAHGH